MLLDKSIKFIPPDGRHGRLEPRHTRSASPFHVSEVPSPLRGTQTFPTAGYWVSFMLSRACLVEVTETGKRDSSRPSVFLLASRSLLREEDALCQRGAEWWRCVPQTVLSWTGHRAEASRPAHPGWGEVGLHTHRTSSCWRRLGVHVGGSLLLMLPWLPQM